MRRCFPLIVVIYASFLDAVSSNTLDIGVVDSDELVDAVMTVKPAQSSFGIGADDHDMIASILASTKDLVETATQLVQNESTEKAGKEMMGEANAKLVEVKEHLSKINNILRRGEEGTPKRALVRKKYSDHNVQRTHGDDERANDISRSMFETMTTFPECVDRLFEHCVGIINRDLRRLGLATIEMVVHEKRNMNQANYNKVVIVTNEEASTVVGRAGDGIVTYPYQWDDSILGGRFLGVDGKWNCLNTSPEDCCATIKQSVPNPDTKGKYVECHIFVPFGGVGNRRRDDRIFVNLSSDGRVHEAPIIT
mmetsp:Transcript_39651/g.85553  ORF Transcript_39651/g.85553 Transcript_39651/m.85553 type:complete len:309 (-) Transcript_39651:159-1085(-)